MNEANQQLVDTMEHVWGSLSELYGGLSDEEWRTPTDCPGWTVQDQLSHIAGSEAGILGDPEPDHAPSDDVLAHTRSEQGRHNEAIVDYRRSRPGPEVLEEFRRNTGRRLEYLRSRTDEEFAAEMRTPIGPAPMSEFISIRIMDAWVHEQDVRRAIGRPGNYDSAAAALALNRILRAMPYVAARRAQAPDGTTVLMDVTGDAGQTLGIGVDGGRGRELDDPPAAPTVRITLDAETFICLGCGRWEPEETLKTGKIRIDGDTPLGESIVRQMNIMP